jgi:hypothetical protein
MKQLVIQEILGDQYPHASFHDAVMEEINISYLNRQVEIRCKLYVGDPDSDLVSRETVAHGLLLMTGFIYLSIDPPDQNYNYDEGGLDISYDDSVKNISHESLRCKIPQDIPEDAFVHCFHINNYNSFLLIAATGAQFSWLPITE